MIDGAIKHLPLTGAEIFGRTNDLAWLDACWRDRVFVASIVAWGGVGKTSLVTKWLANMRDDGWRGAERVFDWSFYRQGAATAGSSDTFFAEALKAFGDPDPTAGSPWDKGERLAKLVREKRTLLVLDGVEPMQYGPGEQEGQFKDPALQTLVKELASNNSGFLVITSRLRLRDLDGLSGAKVQTSALDHLSAEAGAQLLRARGVKGTEEELRTAVNEYGGHGLALTLLGSYLEDVAEGDIRRRKEIGPLQFDERHGGHARRVMEAYEPWFGKTEHAILRMLGLFDRPASEDEIGALRVGPVVPGLNDALVGVIGPDWKRALAKLRRIRLIAADTGNVIDAHPLVRQHFGEQLKRDNLDAWREGHRRLYEFLQTKAPPLPNTLTEMEPLYAAVVHGCLAGKNQEALDEVWWKRVRRGNAHFSTRKLGAFGSEVATLSAFFDPPWERPALGLREGDQAIVLGSAGFALRALGRLQEAAVLIRLGLEREIVQGRWTNAAIVASNLSLLLQSRGALREAIETAREGVSLADKSGDAFERMTIRTTLAAAQHAIGQGDEATALFAEAERMQEEFELGYPILYSIAGFSYCNLLLDQGRTADVRERVAQTLEWVMSANIDILSMALDHLSLGRAHLLSIQRSSGGDLAEATLHIKHAIAGLRNAGQQDYLLRGLLARAALHLHTRAFADARRDLDEAYTLATRCGFRLHEADAHLGYARLAIAEGQATVAREHLEKARMIVEATGYHRRDEELDALESSLTNQVGILAKTSAHTLLPKDATNDMTAPTNERKFDIAIICAVPTELEQVKCTGSEGWTPLAAAHDDPSRYHQTVYTTKQGQRLNVVASSTTQMGMPATAVLATKMIRRFRPRILAMVGIAAGAKQGNQNYGDILAPNRTFDYNSGKFLLKDGQLRFEPDPNPRSLTERMVGMLRDWSDTRRHLNEISEKWPVPAQRTRLQIHVGPMGSGAAVVDVPSHVTDIMEHWRKLIGIEMEAYAAHLACHQAVDPPCEFLCMKSISDFAGGNKDEWRDYAAYTSAQLCHLFLTEEWENLFPR